ncbi:unnamed protein product [Sympodiomycopsis kandeliae]
MAVGDSISPDWVVKQVLQSHEGQVAGHPGTLQSLKGPNGEVLVIKESLDKEVAFYESLRKSSSGPEHELVNQWMPKYYGSLPPTPPSTKPFVILQDLLSDYKRPNVLDIKLGTQLWDDDASEEKRQRMEQASRDSTSGQTGIRLTGWRTWNAAQDRYIAISKAFGKSIKSNQLQLGLKAFFGLLSADESRSFFEVAKSMEAINSERVPDSVAHDSKSMQHLLAAVFLPILDRLISLFEKLEIRIRGGSLLVVYEGDEQLRQTSNAEVMSLRIIDFAHATMVQGKGPDKGVLLGLNTVKRLVTEICQ